MRSSNHQLNELKNKKIAVVGGGISSERDVSLRSSENVFNALKSMGLNVCQLDPATPEFFTTDFDIAFNCLHGKWGEDGGLQGYCNVKQVPYTGSGIKATSVGLNKPLFKLILKSLQMPVPKQYHTELSFPMVIKPISEGSSIGVTIVKSRQEFEDITKKNPKLLSSDYFFEEYIAGQEVTSGVIEINGAIQVLPILEIKTTNDFLDFQAKYTPGLETFILPAKISKDVDDQIQALSKKIYSYFHCKGCIRIDIIIQNNNIKILEMNTNPGLTELSYIPRQAAAMGIGFNELMLHYLDSAK